MDTGIHIFGETHSVMVSKSAFLACHQSYSVGLSLSWGLDCQA